MKVMETIEYNIAEHPFLHGMSAEHLEMLEQTARKVEFAPGEIILRQGEIAFEFYLLCEGKVVLESYAPDDGFIKIHTVGDGEALGWSWLFQPFLWHFQARAIERTKAIAFNAANLLIECQANHDFGFDLMKRIAQVLILRLQATRLQLLAASAALHTVSAPVPGNH